MTVVDPRERVRQLLEKLVLLFGFPGPSQLGVGVTQDPERFRILRRSLDGLRPQATAACQSRRDVAASARPVIAR